MKKALIGVALLTLVLSALAFAGNGYQQKSPGDCVPNGDCYDCPNCPNSVAAESDAVYGPAPNAGDGVSDGSGFDGPNDEGDDPDVGQGPAPNAGDGVSDGSGF